MITVSIAINAQPIYTRSAVNVTENYGGTYGQGEQIYLLDTGEKVVHNYKDGAVKLATKLLKTIKEVKKNDKPK